MCIVIHSLYKKKNPLILDSNFIVIATLQVIVKNGKKL